MRTELHKDLEAAGFDVEVVASPYHAWRVTHERTGASCVVTLVQREQEVHLDCDGLSIQAMYTSEPYVVGLMLIDMWVKFRSPKGS